MCAVLTRYPTPVSIPIGISDKVKTYFLNRVSIKPDSCWRWTGHLYPNGYGMAVVKGRLIFAHRLAYALFSGEIPAGLCVLHSCDHRPCVNPSHLRLGTHAENSADKVSRNRHSAKLSPSSVNEIRKLIASGLTHREIAKQFAVDHSQVTRINTGKIWAHVKETSFP